MKKFPGCLGVIFGGFMMLAIIGLIIEDEPVNEPADTQKAEASSESEPGDMQPDYHYIQEKGPKLGCNMEYQDKLVDLVVAKDKIAFEKAATNGLLTGACTMFQIGEPVHLVDTKIFSGIVKVRRPGSLDEYWINTESVKRNQ